MVEPKAFFFTDYFGQRSLIFVQIRGRFCQERLWGCFYSDFDFAAVAIFELLFT